MRVRLLMACLFIGGMAEARADVIFSATSYGGPSQVVVVCYYNATTINNISVTNSVIIRETGDVLPEVSDNCSGGFFAGTCRTVANINSGNAHSC